MHRFTRRAAMTAGWQGGDAPSKCFQGPEERDKRLAGALPDSQEQGNVTDDMESQPHSTSQPNGRHVSSPQTSKLRSSVGGGLRSTTQVPRPRSALLKGSLCREGLGNFAFKY